MSKPLALPAVSRLHARLAPLPHARRWHRRIRRWLHRRLGLSGWRVPDASAASLERSAADWSAPAPKG